MYESPKSDLTKYEKLVNSCPKCQKEISMWDYVKPGARKANRIKCKSCQSTLRYDMKAIELFLFGSLGLLVAFVPAYFYWPPKDFWNFAYHYLPVVIPLWILIQPLEGMYVRKFRKVELLSEYANKVQQ